MSKLRFVIVLTLLLLVSTTSLFAAGGTKIWYYSNSSFTTVVGGRYTPDWDCPEDDLWWRWGSTSAFRKTFYYDDCYEQGNVTVYCDIWNGTNWVAVTCP